MLDTIIELVKPPPLDHSKSVFGKFGTDNVIDEPEQKVVDVRPPVAVIVGVVGAGSIVTSWSIEVLVHVKVLGVNALLE